MNVNKKYNRSKKEINSKYELLLKEILEHKDFSEILYEINGFAYDKKWGVTERQNIVCLDENNFRIKIEFTDDATYDIENKTFNTIKNNVNESNFENFALNKKDNKKKYRKQMSKSKNKSSHSKDKKDKKDKKINKRKTSSNFHQYFNNNNFYDSSHMKSYICSCGKKCVCQCNNEYCRGDCECEFYDCYKNCYLYNDHFCGCPYDSGEC
jgi:hypothetical protein